MGFATRGTITAKTQGVSGIMRLDRVVQQESISGKTPCCTVQNATAARRAPPRGRRIIFSNNWPAGELLTVFSDCGNKYAKGVLVFLKNLGVVMARKTAPKHQGNGQESNLPGRSSVGFTVRCFRRSATVPS